MKSRAVLDKRLFTRILEGKASIGDFGGFEIVASPMQSKELAKTANRKLSDALFSPGISEAIDAEIEARCKSALYKQIKAELLGRIESKAVEVIPELCDAIIAEFALSNDLVEITEAENVAEVVLSHGGRVKFVAKRF